MSPSDDQVGDRRRGVYYLRLLFTLENFRTKSKRSELEIPFRRSSPMKTNVIELQLVWKKFFKKLFVSNQKLNNSSWKYSWRNVFLLSERKFFAIKKHFYQKLRMSEYSWSITKFYEVEISPYTLYLHKRFSKIIYALKNVLPAWYLKGQVKETFTYRLESSI